MSVLMQPKPSMNSSVSMIQPSDQHITIAGANARTPLEQVAAPIGISPGMTIRAHLRSEPIEKVTCFTEIVPVPVAASMRETLTQDRTEAITELSHYASDLCAPIDCAHNGGGSFESTMAFRGDVSLETLSRNLRDYNLCLKTTVSSESPHFAPSVFRVSADDLDHVCANASGLQHGGFESKFIKASGASVPHNILFHVIKNGTSHTFYGLSYIEKVTF